MRIKGGTLSTYAYRLIWHEICEVLNEHDEDIADAPSNEERKADIDLDIVRELRTAKGAAPPHVGKGIDAMLLMAKGYTCREIGNKLTVARGEYVTQG